MNIAHKLREMAERYPHKRAVVFPESQDQQGRFCYSHLTFEQLHQKSNNLSVNLQSLGLEKGDRVLLFLRPSLEFSIVVFALLKMGAVPVFLDPGMGRKNLLQSIEQIRPKALVALPIVHRMRIFFSRSFASVKLSITTAKMKKMKKGFMGDVHSLPQLIANDSGHSDHSRYRDQNHSSAILEMNPEDTAAILFTSGGTGIPKGVVYTQKIFDCQIQTLQQMFALTASDVDLPGFPLFSLFTICMGMTSCLPSMDPTRPANCDPAKIVQTIVDQGATFAAGSPAIWERVVNYCLKNQLTLPSLRHVVMFGAPVPLALHEKWKKVLTHGTTSTPYGATECLPIANLSGEEILSHSSDSSFHHSIQARMLQGHGTCVGRAVPQLEIKIIKMTDEIIPVWSDELLLPAGEVGEIVVSGPTTTIEYAEMPEETKKAKIWQESREGRVWHRMGDVGFLDQDNLLWFCGRKVHKAHTTDQILFSDPCELIFNQIPSIKRTALIGLGERGREIPAIVVELEEEAITSDKKSKRKFAQKKKELTEEIIVKAKQFPHTQKIQKVFFKKKFPVDIRHNIKIDRLQLKAWAEQKLGQTKGESPQ